MAIKALLPAFVLSIAYGAATYAILFYFSKELGSALFFSTPLAVGALLGFLTRVRIWFQLALGLAAVFAVVGLLFSFSFVGAFCGLTLVAIFLGPLLIGMLLGNLSLKLLVSTRWARRRYLAVIPFIMLPFVHGVIARVLWMPKGLTTVVTEQEVNAPAAAVWRNIVFFEEVAGDPPLLLKLGLPRPSHVEGSHRAPGDIAVCAYDRGVLVKQITQVTPERRLGFRVLEQRLHFEHDVTLIEGSFELDEPCPGGTCLRLSTTYRSHLSPEWLWRPLEALAIETLHRHVIREIEAKAACGLPEP